MFDEDYEHQETTNAAVADEGDDEDGDEYDDEGWSTRVGR